MYKVKYTTAFKKRYKLMKKRGFDLTLLDSVVEVLRHGNPLDAKYEDHVLKAEFAGFHERQIKPDWLLVYLIEDENLTLTLMNTGLHPDLLRL